MTFVNGSVIRRLVYTITGGYIIIIIQERIITKTIVRIRSTLLGVQSIFVCIAY